MISTRGWINKVQLVKFLYLADLYAVKWQGKQITDLEWLYYKFGPYQEDIQRELDTLSSQEIIKQTPQGQYILIQPAQNIPTIESLDLPVSMGFVLDNIKKEWAGSGKIFEELLEYVYSTAPMREVRGNGYQAEEKRPLNLFKEHEKLLQELA